MTFRRLSSDKNDTGCVPLFPVFLVMLDYALCLIALEISSAAGQGSSASGRDSSAMNFRCSRSSIAQTGPDPQAFSWCFARGQVVPRGAAPLFVTPADRAQSRFIQPQNSIIRAHAIREPS
jgi:hypothetical protein